eukprot:14995359-Alexandrium_andersonii.AAC.1
MPTFCSECSKSTGLGFCDAQCAAESPARSVSSADQARGKRGAGGAFARVPAHTPMTMWSGL